MEPSVEVVAGVPRQVDRTRRLSSLTVGSRVVAGTTLMYSLFAAQRIFGFGRTTLWVLFWLCAVWALLDVIWDLRQLPWRKNVRSRPTPQRRLTIWEREAYLLWACVTLALAWPPLLLDPPGVVSMAFLLLPTVALLSVSWWRGRWWPRLALAAAYGTALALLPFWIPVPARRYDVVAVAHCLALAVSSALEDFELRSLLRETRREAASTDGELA